MHEEASVFQRLVAWMDTIGFGYLWFVMLAAWGGTASYVTRLKKNGTAFSFAELIGEWTISGFAGVITAYLCHVADFSYFATAALAGVAGHMGGRGIALMEYAITKHFQRKYGVTPPNEDRAE